MSKKQGEKPDFLKELDMAIMKDLLTDNGKVSNAVGLSGELVGLEEISDICGLPFNGYLGKISTPRPSGTEDEVIVIFESDTPFNATSGVEFDVLKEFVAGSRLLISGKMQTLKNFETGRVLVYVLADFIALSPNALLQNDVAIIGKIAHKPTRRETMRHKRITDVMIITQNMLTAGSSFIPCICWGDTADEVAGWNKGDKVRLLGRCQSREYSKVNEGNGKREIRTAYEVSVRRIERIGEASNEN